jgi:hypothetical protein
LQNEIDEGDFQHAESNPTASQNPPNISSNYEVSVSNENYVPISSPVNGRVKTFCSKIKFNKHTKRKRYDEMEENLFHMKKGTKKKMEILEIIKQNASLDLKIKEMELAKMLDKQHH